MSVPPLVTEAELHALVDTERAAPRRQESLRLLEQDPGLAARIASHQADRDRLRAAFASLTEQPMPDAWVRRIEMATLPRSSSASFRRRYAIAASIALMLGCATVAVREWPPGGTILADAEAARDSVTRGRGVAPDQLARSGSRDDVLQAALGMNVHVPDLGGYGFRLARLELFGHAAQLRYVDERHRLLTIFVRRSNGDVRFDLLRHGAIRICIWQDDVVSAVIMAPMSAGEMMRVASSAYRDLNL